MAQPMVFPRGIEVSAHPGLGAASLDSTTQVGFPQFRRQGREPRRLVLARWCYLSEQRALPARILHPAVAVAADTIRDGPHGSAWFAHHDDAGRVTGIEIRGPSWRNFSAGAKKTLFRLPGGTGLLPRLAVTEAAIGVNRRRSGTPPQNRNRSKRPGEG